MYSGSKVALVTRPFLLAQTRQKDSNPLEQRGAHSLSLTQDNPALTSVRVGNPGYETRPRTKNKELFLFMNSASMRGRVTSATFEPHSMKETQ